MVFRTDASVKIGTGHVMRCLTLADALKQRGSQCRFICREHEGNLLEYVRQRGHGTFSLPAPSDGRPRGTTNGGDVPSESLLLGADWATDAAQSRAGFGESAVDWLIVDHYGIDSRWEKEVRPLCRQLMVIDDLANRPHDCDVLLDQNYYRDQDQRYQGLLPGHCATILGPKYVLLRQEFFAERQRLRSRDGTVKRILVFFGGSDPTHETEKALAALERLETADISVDVVVGATNPNRDSIRTRCRKLPHAVNHCAVSNMAELIARADLGIGGGGSSMWERCYLGLPTITAALADNQLRATEDVGGIGAIDYLGRSSELAAEDYARAIKNMIMDPERARRVSEAALNLVGEGSVSSVVDAMLGRKVSNVKTENNAVHSSKTLLSGRPEIQSE